MGLVAKQSIWNTVIMIIGACLGALNSVLLFPMLMGPEKLGLTGILLNVSIIAAQFASIGMPSVLLKYLPLFKKEKGNNGGLLRFVFRTTFLGVLSITIFLLLGKEIILTPYRDGAILMHSYYFLTIPLLLFTAVNMVLGNYLKALYSSVFPVFLNELFVRIGISILLTLFFFKILDFRLFMYAFVGLYGLNSLLLTIRVYQKGELNLQPFSSKSLAIKTRELYKYGLANFLTSIGSNISNRVDLLMIGALIVGTLANPNLGLQATGIYLIASFIASVIEMPSRGLNNITTPVIAKAWYEKDLDKIKELYKKSSLNQAMAGTLIFCLIWANIDNVIVFLNMASELGEKNIDYSSMKYVVLFLGLAKLIHASAGANGAIIVTSRYYLFATYLMIGLALVTSVTNYIMIPEYGIVGAAIATAFSILLFNLLSFIFLFIKYKFQPYSIKIVLVFLIGFVCYLITLLVPDFNNILLDILIISMIVSVVFISSVLVLNISDDTNTLANRIFSRFKR